MKNNKPWVKHYDGVRETLEYPDHSLYETLRLTSLKFPKNYAYNYFGKKVKYKKFVEQVDECARAFMALGIKRKSIVSIIMPNTPEGIIAFYAINKIGAIANMIHPLSAENEIKYFFNLTKSEYAVCVDMAFNKINKIADETKLKRVILVSVGNKMPAYLKIGYELTKGRKIEIEESPLVLSWKKFIKMAKDYDEEIFDISTGTDTAAILYSGGTTGYPKGIELTNGNFNATAVSGIEACACLTTNDSILAIMPIFHGFGLGICVHTVMMLGGCSIILPQFNAKTFDKLLTKYKPNIIAGVPTLYEALLKNRNLDGVDLSHIKCAISGGDSLSISLKQKIDKFFKEHGANIQIREGYGLTECVTGTCLTPEHEYIEGSIGIPYPDSIYKIVKPGTLTEVKYGEDGEIIISGPCVMKGYYKDKAETEKTLEKDKDGTIWLHTGDMGMMDKEGFIYYKQRMKRMIISSGYNLYPQYIENVIDACPEVLMSCVIGVEDPYKIQIAKAFIVLKPGIEQSDELLMSIKKHCERNLAKYSLPKEYEFRDELPKTLVGKVAYTKLEEEERNKK